MIEQDLGAIPLQDGARVDVDVDGGFAWSDAGAHQLFARRGKPLEQGQSVVESEFGSVVTCFSFSAL